MILNQIDRHIAHTVLISIFVVFAFAVTVSVLFALTDEVRNERIEYSFLDAFWYVILRQPSQFYEALPFVVFIGTMVGMGILSSQSEITVLRAAGVSVFRLFGSLSIPVIVLMILGQLVAEFVTPVLEARAESFKAEQQYKTGGVERHKRHWYREGNLFAAIDRVVDSKQLIGIWHFQINEELELIKTRHAKSGIEEDENGWVLREVDETIFGEEVIKTEQHKKWNWNTLTRPRQIATQLLIDPNKLSLSDLEYQIAYFSREGLNAQRYQLAFWSKVIQPFSVLGLVLVALAMVVGPLREVGMGVRLVAALAVGIIFKYAQDMLGPMSIIWNFPAWIAVLVPTIVVWICGIYFVRRVS